MRIRIPTYHGNANPDSDPDFFDADPDFYLMRIWMRIQITKMMRIHADPDPKHWDKHRKKLRYKIKGRTEQRQYHGKKLRRLEKCL
jgi:hypothetical protein